MTTPFSEDQVIKRTARRMGTNETRVRQFLDAYAEEYIAHARETEPELIRTGIVAPTEEPAKPAKKARAAKKAPAKVTTPASNPEGSESESGADTIIAS